MGEPTRKPREALTGKYGSVCCMCSIRTWDIRPSNRNRKYRCTNLRKKVEYVCQDCHRGFCRTCLHLINAKLEKMRKFLPAAMNVVCPECRFWKRLPGRQRAKNCKALHGVVTSEAAKVCANIKCASPTIKVILIDGKHLGLVIYSYQGQQPRRKGTNPTAFLNIL